MASIFDEIGRKIVQGGQNAAEKTKNMAETVKLRGMISDEEKSIALSFQQIGKRYYEAYGEDPDQLFVQLIASINSSKGNISTYSEQIKQLRGIVNCSKCAAEVPYAAAFCSACGSSMSVASPPSANAFCTKCGSQVASDKAFCTKCGNKVGQAEEPLPPVHDSLCNSCGSSVAPDKAFCTKCGNKLIFHRGE